MVLGGAGWGRARGRANPSEKRLVLSSLALSSGQPNPTPRLFPITNVGMFHIKIKCFKDPSTRLNGSIKNVALGQS